MQLDLFSILLLGLTGFIAGGVNTVAGGGSNLTLPALMMFGLPADIANGTNRLSVLSLIHIPRPRDATLSRKPSSA